MATKSHEFVEAVYSLPTASNGWTGAEAEDLGGPNAFGEYVTLVTFGDGSRVRESWAVEDGRTYFDGVAALDPFPYVEPPPREPDEFDNF